MESFPLYPLKVKLKLMLKSWKHEIVIDLRNKIVLI